MNQIFPIKLNLNCGNIKHRQNNINQILLEIYN